MSRPLSELTLEELWRLFPIQLTEHKQYWNEWYQEEESYLKSFLPKNIELYHIGSTAIRDIWAKPIIDILAEVPLPEHALCKDQLLCHGYLCMATTKSRMDFNKGYTPDGFAERVFHLHLRDMNDHDELYFMTYLNEHPDIATAYEALKRILWKKYEFDRDTYTEMKSDFVKLYTQKAKDLYGKDIFVKIMDYNH